MAQYGNAHTIDPMTAQQDYGRLLGQGEAIQAAYLLKSDVVLFTNRRLILVSQGGITSKVYYHSVPYRAVTQYVVETATSFGPDAELKIWVSGTQLPIRKTFAPGVDIYQVQALLAQFMAG